MQQTQSSPYLPPPVRHPGLSDTPPPLIPELHAAFVTRASRLTCGEMATFQLGERVIEMLVARACKDKHDEFTSLPDDADSR